MDPEACLDCAQDALTEGDPRGAHESLVAYWTWRRRGGFQPRGGDQRAAWLRLAWRARRLPRSWYLNLN
jgi:hypothetical protein